MASEIKKYIEKRYDRWLDYSSYHCSCAGISDESVDVLNEVLCDLLQKPEEKILQLLNKKSGQYTELDYFVLRMIKLNATSNTSPYRFKNRSLPIDRNVDYARLDIEDSEEVEFDKAGYILEKTNEVREIYSELNLSEKAKKVFEFRFFCGESFADWKGKESEKELFEIYYKVISLIKEKVNGKTLF